MTIEEVYEKYKHLDRVISDQKLPDGPFVTSMLYDFWAAVKDSLKEKQGR